jgi:hypothetical protein
LERKLRGIQPDFLWFFCLVLDGFGSSGFVTVVERLDAADVPRASSLSPIRLFLVVLAHVVDVAAHIVTERVLSTEDQAVVGNAEMTVDDPNLTSEPHITSKPYL